MIKWLLFIRYCVVVNMAILNNNLGKLTRLPNKTFDDSHESCYKTSKGNEYTYDCIYRKEDPSVIIKWCRKNFGQRGEGWDFILNNGRIIIEIWNPKYITMYEMFKF